MDPRLKDYIARHGLTRRPPNARDEQIAAELTRQLDLEREAAALGSSGPPVGAAAEPPAPQRAALAASQPPLSLDPGPGQGAAGYSHGP